MRVRVLGTRGSLPVTNPDTRHYGGNTSCVEVIQNDRSIILDAGTGILGVSPEILTKKGRFDILLTHLHMDHIQGLGFFKPLFEPDNEVHIWGPSSSSATLKERLSRYFSPPLFPVHYRDIPSSIELHEISESTFEIGDLQIQSNYIIHPGPTVGYRISNGTSVFTYLPDHEHILGAKGWNVDNDWISGFKLAENADLMAHDSQYTTEEYEDKVGWGHSTFLNAIEFAKKANVKKLLLFHHDPAHTDNQLEEILSEALKDSKLATDMEIQLATEGASFDLA